VRVQVGGVDSPFGNRVDGFRVTVGGALDPSTVKRTYEDIERILHENKVEYVTHEETRPDGRFKSYSVSTS